MPAGPRPTTVMWGRSRATVSRWTRWPMSRSTAASFADGFNTSEVAGVNGVNTVACSGTHTP